MKFLWDLWSAQVGRCPLDNLPSQIESLNEDFKDFQGKILT